MKEACLKAFLGHMPDVLIFNDLEGEIDPIDAQGDQARYYDDLLRKQGEYCKQHPLDADGMNDKA